MPRDPAPFCQPPVSSAGPQSRHSAAVLHSTPRVRSPHRVVEQDGQGKLQSGPVHRTRGEGQGEEGRWRGGAWDMVSKGRVVGCAQGGSHGTTTCFQCKGRATLACVHLPAALGCACPSLLPSPLHSPPPPLRLPVHFSSTCSISHVLLPPPLPQLPPVLTPAPCHQSQTGTMPWGFPSASHLPGVRKALFESQKPSWGWDFSETPGYPRVPRHARASSPWLHEELGRRQGDLRDVEPIRARGSRGSMFQGAQAAASGSEGARGEGLGHGWQGRHCPCSNNHRNM